MRYTETIDWIMCDVCGDYQYPNTAATVGWLQIDSMALGIVADTRKQRHLCLVCRAEFDNFWGE